MSVGTKRASLLGGSGSTPLSSGTRQIQTTFHKRGGVGLLPIQIFL